MPAVSAPCFARFAEVGRTSPRSKKRTTGWRRGRKPFPLTECVNGSSATGEHGARKRNGFVRGEGRRLIKARRSSSRECRAWIKASQVRSYFDADGSCGVAFDGRHLGSGKRTPFTGPPRNRSWRSPSPRAGFRKRGTRRDELGGGDRGARGGYAAMRWGRQRPIAAPRSRRSGCRVVNRDAPRPRSHRMAPSHSVPSSRAFGRAQGWREGRRFA